MHYFTLEVTMKKTINIFLFALMVRCILAQGAGELINTWADDNQWKHAHVGFALHEVKSGKMMAGYNHDKCFVPASSLKLISSLTAWEVLGANYTFKTILAYDGTLTDSVLTGNVYLIGSGDPSLGSKRFEEKLNFSELPNYLAGKVKAAGIKTISGNLFCDESIFDSFPISPSWQWNDLGSGYASGAWGININENEYEIWYNSQAEPGNAAEILTVTPDIPNLILQNEVTIDAENSGDNAYIFGGPYTYEKRIVGTLPKSKQAFRIKGSIPDPPHFLASAIHHQLTHYGISCGEAKVISTPTLHPPLTGIDTVSSMPLKDLVRAANHHSLNMYCEAFLKTLGLKSGSRGSGSEGIALIEKSLAEKGFDITPIHLEDGSGLSARNYVSPAVLSGFLAQFVLKNSPATTTYLLPEAGSEGTVRRLLKNSPAKGHVWMKSGSLNKIMSYTGLIEAKNKEWYTFSVMVNGYTQSSSQARQAIEKLISDLYQKL